MIDKTLEFYQLLMVKRNPRDYPRFGMPEGYTFALFQPGMEEDWCRIHCGVGHFDSMELARKIFREEFLSRPEELAQQCAFVLDAEGHPVGTASVWPGQDFGPELQRIHWVAVSGEHQGKGIAKALMTRVLDIYNALDRSDDFLYLISSTWSWKALGMYQKFGFEPYLGEKPVNFNDKHFEENKFRAWEVVERRATPGK